MKSICLILGIAEFCSALPLVAQENYSLWPRRPRELEQARYLLTQSKWGEAVYLLQPFVADSGVTGTEARQIVSRINVVRYLSRMHPRSHVYVVRRGDTLPKIAAHTQCPVDLLMLYNGIVSPSSLKVGQKLVYINMTLRVEIYSSLNELTVWDEDTLVVSYKILSAKGTTARRKNAGEVQIQSCDSYLQGKRVPRNSSLGVAADKVIRLSDGTVISADDNNAPVVLCMAQADINELALLVRESNSVLWLEQPVSSGNAEMAAEK